MAVGSRARTQMTMRAFIERDNNESTDPYGQAGAPNFTALATIPCRVWSRSRREHNDNRKDARIEEIRCGMPLGTDVTELDRIRRVNDRAGNIIWEGPLRIDAIQFKHTHIEMDLRRINS